MVRRGKVGRNVYGQGKPGERLRLVSPLRWTRWVVLRTGAQDLEVGVDAHDAVDAEASREYVSNNWTL